MFCKKGLKMGKVTFYLPVVVGLMVGQLFAEGERPFKVSNTVRVGYSDNIYRNSSEVSSAFVTDIIDAAFHASLSDRTDFTVKSQVSVTKDKGDAQVYPNLYAMLSHSISPRFLLQLSDFYRSGEKSGSWNRQKNYNYYYNKVELSSDYVLTDKDRLHGAARYEILRNDRDFKSLDYTVIGGNLSWDRMLIPQRTFLSLNVGQSRVKYDELPINTPTRRYFNNDAYYDQTDLSIGLRHTINPEWQGNAEVGATYVKNSFSGNNDVTRNPPTYKGNYDSTVSPLIKVGLVFTPSPRTRFSGDASYLYRPSDSNGYGGQKEAKIVFGAQHDFTAKLMAKATASYAHVSFDGTDSTTGSGTNESENRTDLELRLSYKLNRMNFLEAGVRHSQRDYSNTTGWDENRVDLGWRIELN